MNKLIARQNETLDELIFRHYQQTAGLVEIALKHNPQLAEQPFLAIGTEVIMPNIDNHIHTTKTTVQLWD